MKEKKRNFGTNQHQPTQNRDKEKKRTTSRQNYREIKTITKPQLPQKENSLTQENMSCCIEMLTSSSSGSVRVILKLLFFYNYFHLCSSRGVAAKGKGESEREKEREREREKERERE